MAGVWQVSGKRLAGRWLPAALTFPADAEADQRSKPMSDPRKQTPRQRMNMMYMMDVMRRLEWDLHNTVQMTGRIPAEWHEIAKKTPTVEKEKVTLRLQKDVVKFFRSMGKDYGSRIDDVLRSYMFARLAGLIRGAETIDIYREREKEGLDGAKPKFGALEQELEAAMALLPQLDAARTTVQEVMQQSYADGKLTDWSEAVPWVK
jgi:uncharacterized protein (DUF4415 family)